MTTVALSAFLVSSFVLSYIYRGYLVVLRILQLFAPSETSYKESTLPSVTLLLTVHNEERSIGARLENLLALNYPKDKLEILIASDGSTDRTNNIATDYLECGPVRLLTFDRFGKSAVQNRAIEQSIGDIIAFTDADCTFSPDYLLELVRPFSDPAVGCVTGNLKFQKQDGSIAESQGYYWRYELELRMAESVLGILAVASGSAMAVRRSAFVPLAPNVGEDCSIPLDAVLKGFRVAHVVGAVAWDRMESSLQSEFRARIRMTLRNWLGTWQRSVLLNPMRYPGYAFALWSHKVLRWMSPFFLMAATLSSLLLIADPVLWILPAAVFSFFLLGSIGLASQKTGFRFPVLGTISSFLVANAGFFMGVIKALAGHSILSYRNHRDPETRGSRAERVN